MATAPFNPRQVKLRRCAIFSPTLHFRAVESARADVQKNGIDVSLNVVSIDLYESIFQNTIAGQVQLRETHGFPEYLPLVGTEFLYIEFVVPYNGEEIAFSHTFRIRSVSDQTFPKNEERIYTLNLVTPEFINSLSSRVFKKYQRVTCEAAVKDILQNYLFVDEKQMPVSHFEQTQGMVSCVIPNYTPLQAINFFAVQSLTKKSPHESNFLFFETLKGFYFTSIRKLIDDVETVATYTVNSSQMTHSAQIEEEKAFNHIIGLHQEQAFDVMQDIQSGMLRSKMLHLDILARKWKEEDSRYTETFKRTTHLDKYPVYPNNFDQSVGRNVKLFVLPTNASLANSAYAAANGEDITPIRMHESIVLRNRQLKEITHLKTYLDVPGQPKLRAGSVINVNYPSSRAIQNLSDSLQKTAPQLPTPYYSGRHLVTSVRHRLTQVSLGVMEYRMHLEASRDSLGAPLIDYKENPKDTD